MDPTAAAVAALTDHFHRFLEAVKAACGLNGRRGLLGAPMTLWTWLRSRRARDEAATAVAEALGVFLEQFKLLLEEFTAARLGASDPAVGEAPAAERSSSAYPSPQPSPSGPAVRARLRPAVGTTASCAGEAAVAPDVAEARPEMTRAERHLPSGSGACPVRRARKLAWRGRLCAAGTPLTLPLRGPLPLPQGERVKGGFFKNGVRCEGKRAS